MAFRNILGKELLATYGKAVLECNKVEMYVSAILKNNQSKIPDYFGPKISLIGKYINNKILISKLDKLNQDRILLAHGFAINNQKGELYSITIKGGVVNKQQKLTKKILQDIFNEASDIGASLIVLGKLKHIKW